MILTPALMLLSDTRVSAREKNLHKCSYFSFPTAWWNPWFTDCIMIFFILNSVNDDSAYLMYMCISAVSEPWTVPWGYIYLFINGMEAAADVPESWSDPNGDKPQSDNGSISQAEVLFKWTCSSSGNARITDFFNRKTCFTNITSHLISILYRSQVWGFLSTSDCNK